MTDTIIFAVAVILVIIVVYVWRIPVSGCDLCGGEGWRIAEGKYYRCPICRGTGQRL